MSLPVRKVLRGSGPVAEVASSRLRSSEADAGNGSDHNRCGASGIRGGSPGGVGSVDAGHELAVGGAGGGEVLVAFGELQTQVDDLLLEPGDLLVEGVDVGRGAQPGLAPGVLAECFGEALLEVLDAGVEPGGAFVGGEQVGLQRGSGDRRAGALASPAGGSAARAWIFSSRSRWR